MDFKLNLPIAKPPFQINHNHKIIMVGSCFGTNIGNFLKNTKFNTLINPCGIVFNPQSIANSLNFSLQPEALNDSFFFINNNVWHSWLHHSSFNHHIFDTFKNEIINKLQHAKNQIHQADFIFITPGTAFAYKHKELDIIVANCHKMPGNLFDKMLLQPQQVIDILGSTILNIKKVNKTANIVFTISPVKHLKDGVENNNISKGILHYAIYTLCNMYNNIHYFPAYEIVNDELRDYRFYKQDFAHPNDLAIEYVWKRFKEIFFDEETRSLVIEIEKLNKMIAHKPLSEAGYSDFLNSLHQKMIEMQNKFKNLSFEDEIKDIEHKLSQCS